MAVRTNNLAATGTAVATFFYYAGPQMIQSVQQTPAPPSEGRATGGDKPVRLFSAVRQYADPQHANDRDL